MAEEGGSELKEVIIGAPAMADTDRAEHYVNDVRDSSQFFGRDARLLFGLNASRFWGMICGAIFACVLLVPLLLLAY
ncbi:MAG: tetrahydromethanopterin S-methyltransferase subunit F [Euryarchaeota archaeon]